MKRAVARQRPVGEHLLKVTVEVSVSNEEVLCCGLFCPYQADTDKSTVSCVLEGTKKRLKWGKDYELLRSAFCKKHEQVRPAAQMIKSFLV